ncbi:MAG: AAA family ATPase [Nocardioidaceae bacterium]
MFGECAAQARAGTPTAALLEGEAGIGKTRLVQEAVSSFRAPDDVVAVGHGVALTGGELPYGTVADSLHSLVVALGVDPVRAAAREFATTLAAVCPPLGPAEATTDRVRLFGGYVATIERLAADRLVWLVIEDLHWADSSSRDLFGYLVRVAAACRLLTVINVRTNDSDSHPSVSEFVSNLVSAPGVNRVTLGPLSANQAREQVIELVEELPSQATLERLVMLGQGNPFAIEQLVAAKVGETGPCRIPSWNRCRPGSTDSIPTLGDWCRWRRWLTAT